MESEHSGYMEAIAKELLGEPNPHHSSARDLRFGTHGSISINLDKDGWYDHERKVGGGPLSFVENHFNFSKSEACRWLEERGYKAAATPASREKSKIVATYRYRDENGELLFEVVRKDPKKFLQRTPDGNGGWLWSAKNARKVLYRLPELIAADPGELVFVVEGEKDADRLAALGLVSTTNAGGAGKWHPSYARSLAGRTVVILPDNDNAGRIHAEVVLRDVKPTAKAIAVLKLNGLSEKGDVSDWLATGGTKAALVELAQQAIASAIALPSPEPTPILRPKGAATDIPWDALGELQPAVAAIETLTQAPPAIAMQAALAATSLAAQPHADVETLGGPAPIALFQVTVAESGERKSGCDRIATKPIREFEQQQVRDFPVLQARYEDRAALYDAARTALIKQSDGVIERAIHGLDDLGPRPVAPPSPHMLLSDPTVEGILRHFEEGQPSIAVFSDEGGQLFGGHAMSAENRLKSSAAFSKLWDGAPVNRTRASAPAVTYYGRRASFHVMLQPRIAEAVLADPVLRDQGLLSRTLLAWPDSRIGYRLIPGDPNDAAWLAAQRQAEADLADYDRRITGLLERSRPYRDGNPRELVPRLLRLDLDAREVLVAFANEVERAQRPGEKLEGIRGFASKAAEQAARIAAIFTIYADPDAETVGLPAMQNAIKLTVWYLREAQRLLDCGQVPEDLLLADALRGWLVEHWNEDQIDVRTVVRLGPKRVRTAERTRQMFKILEEHGWLIPLDSGRRVAGRTVRVAWQVVRA